MDSGESTATPESPAAAEPPRLRYVDLVLGAWRPREAAAQLATVLGVTLPQRSAPAAAATVTDDIDIAALGDPVVLEAYEAATRIAAALPPNGLIAVLAPRYGLPLRQDNEWFFLFLKRRNVSLVLIGDEPPANAIGRPVFERRRGIEGPPVGLASDTLSPEQRRLLRFFPGLLPRALAAEFGITIGNAFVVPVATSHFLVPPAYRDTDPRSAGRDFDAMADLEAKDDGLKALAQTFCTAYFADSAAITATSAAIERAGGVELAEALATRARHVARTPEKMATADVRRQELLRHHGRFSEMIALPPPSRQASEVVRQRLDRLRLEAAVAAGQIADRAGDLAPLAARMAASESMAVEDLIPLDDFAAALAAAGEMDRAVALAEQIGAVLADRDADQRLVFRNAMNRARIHGRRGEPALQRAALDAAFATSAGIRNFGEVMEMNALLAGAELERQSRPAQLAWLRAALAWLAVEPPEALSASAVGTILGVRKYTRRQLDLDISEAIAERIAAAWPEGTASRADEYPAVRAATETMRPRRSFGGPGASILWLDPAGAAPAYIRPRLTLVRLVQGAVATLCPAFSQLGGGTILVDHNLGLDIPATREQALTVALRTRVETAVYGEETVALDPASRIRLTGGLIVGLSPAVLAVEGGDDRLTLRFRRRLAPATLTGREAEAVAPLRDGAYMPLGSLAVILGKTAVDAERLYRGLEALAIVRVDVKRREEAAEHPPSDPDASTTTREEP